MLVVTFAALALLLAYFARHADRPLLWLPTGLLLGGALGNLIDRIHQGYVTDFIHLPHWPAFNVADMCITGGVVALVLVLELGGSSACGLRSAPPTRGRAARPAARAEPLGSRAQAQRLIDAGRVTVDGEVRPKRHRVAAGERVEVAPEPVGRARPGQQPRRCRSRSSTRTSTCSSSTSRPASSCIPARGHRGATLAEALAGRAAGGEDPARAGIVHRLDKDTSGLLVVAKSEAVHRALQEAIRRRELRREYLALVEGCPPARSGTIDAPIGRDRRVRTRMSTDTDVPRAARTHFELERALRGLGAAARDARDRPHAPDPRPPAGDRPSGRGRPGVREGRARSASRASSCTPRGSRSRIRSRASRST